MPTVFISAGEKSGDRHGAKLMSCLKKCQSSIAFTGVGGSAMRDQGQTQLADLTPVSTIGFIEPIRHLFTFITTMRRIKRDLRNNRPDVVIAIDYQGFNMLVLKAAKKLGIPTVYYISPQEWQWGTVKGGEKVVEITDLILSIFPEEHEFYDRLGAQSVFIGHPIVDLTRPDQDRIQTRKALNVQDTDTLITVFPGSRPQEIKLLAPTLLDSAQDLLSKLPNAKVVISVAEDHLKPAIQALVTQTKLPATLVQTNSHNLIAASDCSLTTSGTITLEHALLGTPFVAIYRLSNLSYSIAKRLMGKSFEEKVRYISLPNILLKQAAAPEFFQHAITTEAVSQAALGLLTNDSTRQTLLNHFDTLRDQLNGKDSVMKAALEIIGLLRDHNTHDSNTGNC
ncbi:lipid-A-disaccharide synthase [bacterium]|jgi:lipid-A-disaccharide synthase|nr:lipid-A-disaccharide synthase [bacterium]